MSDTIYSRPGETVESELKGASPGLLGTVGFRVKRVKDGVVVLARTTDDIREDVTVGPEGEELADYTATFTAPDVAGRYTIFWDTGKITPTTTASDDLVVTYDLPSTSLSPVFATKEDIATRLGRTLTEAEAEQAEFLLHAATAVIEAAADKAAAEIDPIPPVLRFVTVELVCRAMANPQSLSSQSEALGAYSHTERFRGEANSDLLLTKMEELMVRQAVYGQLSGTGQMKSLASDLCVFCGLAPTICGGEWLGDEWLCGCEGS